MPHHEPRKISMAYLMGLTDKPFKTPKPELPPPPKQSYGGMFTTPGAAFEWAASDGRKGRLTTPRRAKLTSRNLAKVPSDMMIPEKTAITVAKTEEKEKKDKKDKKEMEKKKEETNGWGAADATWGAGDTAGTKDETPAWGDGGNNAWDQSGGGDEGIKKDDGADANNSWGNDANTGDNADANTGGDTPWGAADATNTQDNAGGDNNTGGNAWDITGNTGGNAWETPDTNANNDANSDDKAKENWRVRSDDNGFGDWTAEQDAELMKRKTENENWAQITEAMGKDKDDCAKRFKAIKPDDWKPNAQGGKNKGGGKKEKNKKGKAYKAQEKEAEKEKEKEDDSNSLLGFDFLRDDDNAGGGDADNNATTSGAAVWDTTSWGPPGSPIKSPVTIMNSPAFAAPNNGNIKSPNRGDQYQSMAGALQSAFNTNNSRGPHRSPQHPQQQPPTQSGNTADFAGSYCELTPDATFSVQELMVLAKIYKRDREMTWMRLASRFKDKVGRDLHPDVIEAKIMEGVRLGQQNGGGGGQYNWGRQ